MKVENISSKLSIKKRNSRKINNKFEIDNSKDIDDINNVNNINNVDSLVMLQEVDEYDDSNDAKIYGEKLLDMLDELKVNIIDGKYSVNTLNMIIKSINKNHHYIDPHLNDIIKEIEMRAEIELAKLQKIIE
jgi:hypothetical protein